MSFHTDKSHTFILSLWKDHLVNPSIYFLNKPLEELQSLQLLGLTISYDISWANHRSMIASKAAI